MPSRNHGFTLLEVLVVASIVAILGGFLFAAVQKIRAAGDRAVGILQMREIGLALYHYGEDNDGYLPGPLKSGQGVCYIENKKDGLATVLGPYLGVVDLSKKTPVKIFMPPAYVRDMGVKQAEGGNPFVMNISASNGGVHIWPWGSDGQTSQSPMKIHAVPGRVWAFCDADQQNPHVVGQPWAAKTPDKIVHGEERLALYFDGSVGPISQAALSSSRPAQPPPPPPPRPKP